MRNPSGASRESCGGQNKKKISIQKSRFIQSILDYALHRKGVPPFFL